MEKTRFARNGEAAEIWTITPDLAQELLNTSIGNRKLSNISVDAMASAMKRGEWRITSQGIGIDKNGNLRDAHHRLNAVIKSGTPIQSVVILGMREDANEVIDIGRKRNLSDLMNLDKRESQIVSLAMAFAVGKPFTVDQARPYYEAGLGDCAHALIQYCGTSKYFFSSASIKLAACITVLNGGNVDYVFNQYRAMITHDWDAMSESARALWKQNDQGKTNSAMTAETVARGLKVFDIEKSNLSRINVTEADIDNTPSLVRSVLNNMLRANECKRAA